MKEATAVGSHCTTVWGKSVLKMDPHRGKRWREAYLSGYI